MAILGLSKLKQLIRIWKYKRQRKKAGMKPNKSMIEYYKIVDKKKD